MEMEMEEKFPAGMRVLAVDDDSTCLMILATMLRKCQYDVTTANEATKALQILREKKAEFDLIISDIEMPNMDGFELLQQVGLQMDIPVLLLSAHDDKERVMKGIAHGACHYLLKPARIEELKHIWQHVVRRKLGSRKALGVLKGTLDVVDHKPNKKRKDENDQQSTQKKPRVFWLPELHRKFLAAVNQLGVDKAVPKKILELMNVENITRENVASHLQKHRMYLKKRNSVPSPQANMFADFGSAHSAYGQLVPRVDNAQMMVQTVYTSYPVAANVLTTASSQGSSSEIIRWARPANLMTIDREPNVGSSLQSMNQSRDLPHGMSIASEFFDNGEQVKDTTPIADFSSINFANASMHNDFSVDFADNDLVLDGHLLNASQQEFSGNLSADSLTLDYPPKLPKLDGYNDSSPTFIQFESFYTEHSPSPSVGLRDNMAAAAAHLVINPHERSSLNSVVNILPNSTTDLQHQEHPISNIARHNTDHNPIPVGIIVPGEFSTSSVSKSDIMDYPLTRHPDNVEAGEASNQLPTHSKI